MTDDKSEKTSQLSAAENFESKPLSGYLLWSVFITGAGVMSAEMAAPRLLAPSFGASQLIWTNIIGTILTALTLGAFAGGKLADRWPSERAYASVLIISGVSLAAVPFISRPFLAWASSALFEMKIGLFLISLFSVSVFFAPPVFLLGMLGPWAIKIAGSARSDLGSVAGVIAAFSAAGSIAGTFLTSLFFLPVFGTRATMLFTAALIASTGAWKLLAYKGYFKSSAGEEEKRPAILLSLLIILLGSICAAPLCLKGALGPVKNTPGQLYETESAYQYVEVVKSSSGRKFLLLNEGVSCHSILPAKGFLTGGCWDYICALPMLAAAERKPLRVLILGLAAGTIAREIDHFYGNSRGVEIEGVEIDPAVIEAGKLFFGLEKIPSLTVRAADARFFLKTALKEYDLIIADAFLQPYIPFHMITREFYAECLQRLSPDGIFAINLGAKRGDSELSDAFAATLNSVFPHVHCIIVNNEGTPFDNHIFTGARLDVSPAGLKNPPKGLERVAENLAASWRELPQNTKGFVFTDDRSPIEMLTERLIIKSAFER
ncbi:MAG TPA: fused MFS/spermidine synthase [Candidatus Wallbacteria bacterium]|nr:fused MFS/spermidine synthase [Candidatus Wallbacteria bacterium]